MIILRIFSTLVFKVKIDIKILNLKLYWNRLNFLLCDGDWEYYDKGTCRIEKSPKSMLCKLIMYTFWKYLQILNIMLDFIICKVCLVEKCNTWICKNKIWTKICQISNSTVTWFSVWWIFFFKKLEREVAIISKMITERDT